MIFSITHEVADPQMISKMSFRAEAHPFQK